MIPISRPAMGKNALKYVSSAIKRGDIAKGPFIAKFEAKFAATQGFKHASATCNGTMALFLALRALGIENGEVILPTLTFAATADAVLMAGAKPVFADIDEASWSLSPETIEPHITEKTKAIIAVDIYGVPSKIKPLRRFNLPIIQDACESLGSTELGEADITCFSFFGNKVITTGEGGMCCTDSHEYKKLIDKLRNHGRDSGYFHELRGSNGRMSNISAAIGLSQTEDLAKNLKKRRQIFKWYGEIDYEHIGPWLMFVRLKDYEVPALVANHLIMNGIEARAGFTPLHLMPAYYQEASLPTSEFLSNHILLLPCYPELAKADVMKIKKAIKKYVLI